VFTKDELARLRQLLKLLESREMTIRQDHKDVAQREIDKLKADIKGLDSLLARVNDAGR
jgi:phage terminase Nu1 subunit (DNA packaging protein)